MSISLQKQQRRSLDIVTPLLQIAEYRRAEKARRGGRDEGFRNLSSSLARARQRDAAADCSDSPEGFATVVIEEVGEIFKPGLVLPSLRLVVFGERGLQTRIYTRKDDSKAAFQVGFAQVFL